MKFSTERMTGDGTLPSVIPTTSIRASLTGNFQDFLFTFASVLTNALIYSFRSKFANHAQLMSSVENARSILKRYCDKLYISEAFSKRASEFYKQLLIKKFMNGRRLNVVLAACLYITVRSEGANVIILDISDVSEANVYEIGRYYFQIVKLLHVNIQTVDPSEYTMRFVDMLRIGTTFFVFVLV